MNSNMASGATFLGIEIWYLTSCHDYKHTKLTVLCLTLLYITEKQMDRMIIALKNKIDT